jgi:hypothetical protein
MFLRERRVAIASKRLFGAYDPFVKPSIPLFGTLLGALLLATAASAGTYTVTTTADDGPGSFRAALLAGSVGGGCESPCTIRFAIPGPVPAGGSFTIRPLSPLPILVADSLTIDGTTQAQATGDTNPFGPEIELDGTLAGYRSGIKLGRVVGMTLRGLAINRFEGHGVFIDNSSNVRVTGCYIGVDPTGTRALGNGMDGVAVRGVYGGVSVEDNIISGNAKNGVYVTGFIGAGIVGNRIGVSRTLSPLGNGANGVDIVADRSGVDSNVIAHNAHFGIAVGDGGRVQFARNALYGNGLMSIGLGHDGPDVADPLDADAGPNGRVNAPVLTSARTTATLPGFYIGEAVTAGTIQTTPNTTVTIHVYAAPHRGPLGHAEANVLVASATFQTDASGNATFTLTRGVIGGVPESLLIPTGWIAATATTEEGTSELSAPVPVQSDTIRVTTIADAGPGSLRDAIDRANQSACGNPPCWIVFQIPHEQLTNGVAVIEPLSPLPAITSAYVHLDGSSQTWTGSDTNPNGPEVEIRGTRAGAGPGLKIGTPEARVTETFIHALAITGFAGAGISVDATEAPNAGGGFDIRVLGAFIGIDPATGEARGNGGDGVSVRGARSSFAAGSQWVVRNSVIGGNGGHGVRIEGQAMHVQGSQIGVFGNAPRPNGGAGIFAGAGLGFSISANTIAFNRGAGVVTAPDARAVMIEGTTLYANGGLGIDRNDDGVGGGTAEGVTPRPAVLSATYDAAKNVTVIEGEIAADAPSFPLATDGRSEIHLTFFSSDEPDPSGFGEGARIAGNLRSRKGERFRAEVPGDLRGRFMAATASLALCYYEFGCHPRDTSEFSNAALVK